MAEPEPAIEVAASTPQIQTPDLVLDDLRVELSADFETAEAAAAEA